MTSLPFDDDSLGFHDAERSRHKENRGRGAGVYAQFHTEGQGFYQFEDRIEFGLTFTQKPFMAYGCEISIDAVRDALDIDDSDPLPWLPLVTGYVVDWDQDDKRNYTGAWVGVSVWWPTIDFDTAPGIPIDAPIRIDHYFTFNAVAIKNVPKAAGD